MKNYLLLPSLVALLFMQGCLLGENEYDKRIREADEAIEAYLLKHEVEAEKASNGVYAELVKENPEGKQVQEDHVAGILYTVTQLEGEKVLETYKDTLNPLRFSHSANALIPAGLNYEMDAMREGEIWRFYIPSYQAFGEYSHKDLFPPNTNLIIEVQLVELKTEEEVYEMEVDSIQNWLIANEIDAENYPNGLYYQELERGNGASPNDYDYVEFHFTRKYLDGTVIETTEGGSPIQVYLNDGWLVPGLEAGIKLMRRGGKARLIMPSKMAFGKSLQVIPQQVRSDWEEEGRIEPLVKPYRPVIYEVELL